MYLDSKEREMLSLAQQYILEKGLKFFGKPGFNAIIKEMTQLDGRTCFEPIGVKELIPSKRKDAQIALDYLSRREMEQLKTEQFITVNVQDNGWVKRTV